MMTHSLVTSLIHRLPLSPAAAAASLAVAPNMSHFTSSEMNFITRTWETSCSRVILDAVAKLFNCLSARCESLIKHTR